MAWRTERSKNFIREPTARDIVMSRKPIVRPITRRIEMNKCPIKDFTARRTGMRRGPTGLRTGTSIKTGHYSGNMGSRPVSGRRYSTAREAHVRYAAGLRKKAGVFVLGLATRRARLGGFCA